MARATMEALIGRVRRLVNDVDEPIWTDDEIQDALDKRRHDVRYLPLTEAETLGPGSVDYLDFYATWGDWEADVVLYDAQYNPIVPDSADLQVGHWSFEAEPLWPVTLIGKTYDLYAAAADLLEIRATQLAGEFDFSADGGQFVRSQKRKAYEEMANGYRRRQRPGISQMVRGDVNV
jgi:hypothetical protein